MMKNVMTLVGLVAVALVAVGCGFDPVGTCQAGCQAAIDNGCGMAGTDCTAQCSTAQADYDAVSTRFADTGCLDEAEAALSCASTNPCDAATRCATEQAASASCIATYCMANPMATACTTP